MTTLRTTHLAPPLQWRHLWSPCCQSCVTYRLAHFFEIPFVVHSLHEVLQSACKNHQERQHHLQVCLLASHSPQHIRCTHQKSRSEPRVIVSSASPFWHAVLVEKVIPVPNISCTAARCRPPHEPFAPLCVSKYIGNYTKSCKSFLNTLDTRILVRTMISSAILRNPSGTGLTGAACFSSGMLC